MVWSIIYAFIIFDFDLMITFGWGIKFDYALIYWIGDYI